jgi:hypothetical protein
MQSEQARAVSGESASVGSTSDLFPVLQQRKQRPLGPGVEVVRRELWRAFQRGALSEDELASTLDRLEFERTQ